MNRVKFTVILSVLIALTPIIASAQGGITPVPVAAESQSLLAIIERVISFAFGFLLVIAALFIVYAAYLYLTSGGSEDGIKSARNYIIYAVIAIAIAFLARIIPFIARQVLGQA